MKIITAIIIMAIATASHATGNDHGKPDNSKPQSSPVTQQVGVSVKQSARAEARAQAKASARSAAIAAGGSGTGGNASGGTGIGGNAEATGGAANATGGQVIVNGVGGASGNGSGLTGRMVPDMSATSPITSTSCRNGITAGGSGNGWGGLLGFFSEDEICELRLLWEQFRTAGMHDKADKLLDGMMLMRCEKLPPDSRKLFGDLCPKTTPAEIQNVAFSSAG